MSSLSYERRITVRPQEGRIEAQMQDFCHHVRVEITHADGRITHALGEGIRLPWNSCPLGVAGLSRLTGLSVTEALDRTCWPGGAQAQCVHAADVAVVALGHLEDREPFTYAISVTPATGRVRAARICRDGRELAEWTLDGMTIVHPAPVAGRSLRREEFRSWAAELDASEREIATVLRRACHIAPSRDVDLDAMRVAADISAADSSCYTMQPQVISEARRVRGASTSRLTEPD